MASLRATVLSYSSSCQNRKGVRDRGKGDLGGEEEDYDWPLRRKDVRNCVCLQKEQGRA